MFAIAFDMDINGLTLPLSLKINNCIILFLQIVYAVKQSRGLYATMKDGI